MLFECENSIAQLPPAPRERTQNSKKRTGSHIFGAAEDENAGELSEERERGVEQRNREELCCQIKHTKKEGIAERGRVI
jgi:hypothetical protein